MLSLGVVGKNPRRFTFAAKCFAQGRQEKKWWMYATMALATVMLALLILCVIYCKRQLLEKKPSGESTMTRAHTL